MKSEREEMGPRQEGVGIQKKNNDTQSWKCQDKTHYILCWRKNLKSEDMLRCWRQYLRLIPGLHTHVHTHTLTHSCSHACTHSEWWEETRQTDREGAAITCRDTGALLFSQVLSRMLKVAFTSVQKEACVPGERAHMSTSQFVVNHKVYKLSN